MTGRIIKRFTERFTAILDELDAFDGGEELEELNAQLEDTIFMLDNLEEDETDDLLDTLEEMEELIGEYRAYAETDGELLSCVNELEMACEMAKNNLNG